MTVGELIAALRTVPEDMPVFVDGYEGGYDQAKTPRVAKVSGAGDLGEWFLGSHDDADEDDEDSFDAVIIGR
jgi:hypothetical protein